MLNGRYDLIFPFETQVKPMFDLLGTPPEHKKLKVYDSDPAERNDQGDPRLARSLSRASKLSKR